MTFSSLEKTSISLESEKKMLYLQHHLIRVEMSAKKFKKMIAAKHKELMRGVRSVKIKSED